MIKEIIKSVIIVIVAVIISVLVGGNNQSAPTGAASGASHYQHESFLQGLSGGTRDQFSVSNVGALTTSGAITANGIITSNAGVIRSYTNSTSTTATTYTAVQADILNYDTILMTPNVGALTITFPATSTLTSMVPSAGDTQETCLYNATSTSAATITITAGAGMDLERVATSTTSGSTGVLAIPATGSACFKFVRQTNTDISVLMTSFLNAD